jgi:hypothetical protein
MHRYKEIALMQREEYDSRLDHVKDSLKMAEKAREKLRKLQYKVDRLEIACTLGFLSRSRKKSRFGRTLSSIKMYRMLAALSTLSQRIVAFSGKC